MRKPTKAQLDAHERMKAELRIAGTSLADIARDVGVTDGAVTQFGKRISRSARIEAALAAALGMTPQELFPDLRDGEDPA